MGDPRVLFSINELDKNCKNHLVSIKILRSHDETADITEKDLIESRSNKSLDNHQSDKICNYHRYEYGVYWRTSRKCQHPPHTKKGNLVQSLVYSKIFLKTIFQSVANYV